RWEALSGIAWNRNFLVGLTAIIACLGGHYYVRRISQCRDWPLFARSTERMMLALSIVMIVSVYTFEIARVFKFESLPFSFESTNLAMHVTLSIAWTLNAGVLLIIGFVRWDKLFRLFALGLFALTIAKVFVFDLSKQVVVYRIISFGVLGVVLLLASLLYQRLSARFAESISNPALPGGTSD
ncbi:MAG: DUF2339 domain-containing protein, partial [Planctomycetota bacterium]|nr:DUF2339 domain-containing protein [Planctomycetota bacterium]